MKKIRFVRHQLHDLYHFFFFFFFFTFSYTNVLLLHLQRIYTVQKKMAMCKKDDRPPHQNSRFFIASKGGLPLDI